MNVAEIPMTPEQLEALDADDGGLADAHIDPHFVMKRDGQDFVLYKGLLDMLHQLSGGRFSVDTDVIQFPNAGNGGTAVVKAVVSVWSAANAVPQRIASGIGDAGPESVNRMIAPHCIRMAETRAIARALRVICNIGATALEELGGDGGGEKPTRRDERSERSESHGFAVDTRTGEIEGITVDGKLYTRAQVWSAYQQRMGQARDAKITVPRDAIQTSASTLPALVSATQAVKRALGDAGKLPEER